MVDILQVLEGLAYVGFIAGAIFAVLELRGIGRDRRVSIIVDMYNSFVSVDMTDAYSMIMTGNFQNAEDMERQCSYSSLTRVAGFYEALGYLCRNRLVDPKVVMDLMPAPALWSKMAPWIAADRERSGYSEGWTEFEYLAKATEVHNIESDYSARVHAELNALKARAK